MSSGVLTKVDGVLFSFSFSLSIIFDVFFCRCDDPFSQYIFQLYAFVGWYGCRNLGIPVYRGTGSKVHPSSGLFSVMVSKKSQS